MARLQKTICLFFLSFIFVGTVYSQDHPYKAEWESLRNYQVPEWYEDAKLGFWVHWGVYSVPAFMGEHASEWYGRWMYCKEGQERDFLHPEIIFEHHKSTYGDQSVFGYKDFIPMFKAENFNADEWAQLCVDGGAKFFCMMGVHHDSFCMWDTKLSKWNSVNMGPKRDLVGEIKEALNRKGLKFGVSNHSGWNYAFFQFNHINGYDAKDSTYQDLYGNPIISQVLDTLRYIPGEGRSSWLSRVAGLVKPSERDMDRWLARTEELADLYQPDLYYFDWGMNIDDYTSRRLEFGAHYYSKAIEWGKGTFGNPGVVINYKNNAFENGTAVNDMERGRRKEIAPITWQTDDCVYAGHTWGYSEGVPIKPTNQIIDELIDIVSKRGVLMLSFAPKADGSFPDDQQKLIHEMGAWLKVCGEAIYATRPWVKYGEGTDGKDSVEIRFTRNKAGDILYATLLDWKDGQINVGTMNTKNLGDKKIKNVTLLGSKGKLKWSMSEDGLLVEMPTEKPDHEYAYPIRIELK